MFPSSSTPRSLRSRTLFALAATVLLAWGALALAHARLEGSDPEAGTVLAEAPEAVTLRFTEAVETRFSMFRIFFIETAVGEDVDPAALHEEATEEVESLLAAPESDRLVPAEADEAEGPTAEVVLRPEETLPPGAYLVAWRVLAVDGHPSTGHLVFVVEPEAR